MMKTGDYVLIIESESPLARATRLGERPKRKKHDRPQRVGWLDRVKSVTGKKAKFERDADAESDDTGLETAQSRKKREDAGEPTREILVIDPSWFPTPFPITPGVRIDVDVRTVEAIRKQQKTFRR